MQPNDMMTGKTVVVMPDGGTSYWQPRPANGHLDIVLSPETMPYDGFVQGFQTIAARSHIREHLHEDILELLVCIEGEGVLIYDGKTVAFTPRTVCFIGYGVKHTVINDSDRPLTMLWLQIPPGSERFFGQVGRARRPDEPAPASFERPAHATALAEAAGLRYQPDDAPPKR